MPKLPQHVLRLRLKNELEMCKKELQHKIEPEDPEFRRFPTRIFVTLVNVPGPVLKNGRVTFVRSHRFSIIITDEYPYRKPIVQWLSDIFHPNITKPEEGGHFCSGLLKTEGFNFSLVSFIKSVESLLMNPNPYSPWDTQSCMAAAKYFHEKKQIHGGGKIRPVRVPMQRVQAPGPYPDRQQQHPQQHGIQYMRHVGGINPRGAPIPQMTPMQQAMMQQRLPQQQRPYPYPQPTQPPQYGSKDHVKKKDDEK